jgi:predicted  nucleic acid-binding Zn-ribbon protein
MGIDDSILVRCTRCKSKFRERVGRLRDGYSRQCPSCECMVFFMEGSPNKDIAAALREAERVRKALRQEAAEKLSARPAARPEPHDEETEPAPSLPSRRIERRARPGGRSE